MDDKDEKVALFRYGLIAPLVLETLPRGELTRRAQQIAARLYDFPHSTRRQVSVDTLLDWTLRYRRNGLEALSPKPLQDRGQALAVDRHRRSHRTAQTREPASYRRRSAARTGHRQRSSSSRQVHRRARVVLHAQHPRLFILYVHFSSARRLRLLRLIALELDVTPALGIRSAVPDAIVP